MTRRAIPQLTALTLSTLVTLATLGGLDRVAGPQGAELILARATPTAAAQVVVIGQRAPRS